jgi:hypothetical protein
MDHEKVNIRSLILVCMRSTAYKLLWEAENLATTIDEKDSFVNSLQRTTDQIDKVCIKMIALLRNAHEQELDHLRKSNTRS